MKLIYLDQNGLSHISLQKNQELLNDFVTLLRKKEFFLGISFPHIYETAKGSDVKRKRLIYVMERIDWMQMTPLIRILDAEVKNEFFRFLKLKQTEEISPIGPVFKGFGSEKIKFAQLIDFVRSNSGKADVIKKTAENHDKKMKELLSTCKANLQEERKATLVHFRDTILRNRETTGLRIELPPKSLNDEEFIDFFDWIRCPYLNLYVAFQHYRYRDKKREPSGDMADAENAILGALGSSFMMIEKNASQILCQLPKAGFCYKATVFSRFEGIHRCLKEL